MKRPLIYGLTALCVLSTPTLVTEFKNPTFTKVYRSIASSEVAEFVENLDASDKATVTTYQEQMREKLDAFRASVKEHQKEKNREDFKDLPDLEKNNLKNEEVRLLSESTQISKHIQEGIKKLSSTDSQRVPSQFLIDYNTLERDLKNSIIKNPIKGKIDTKVVKVKNDEKSTTNNDQVVEEASKEVASTSESNTCEASDPIAELQAQIKELLKDKEEALAKVEKEKEKKKKRKEQFKKAQDIYAMGMIFGQGFRASFSNPAFRFQHPMAQFSMQSPFSNFVRPASNPWMSLMSSYFSGNRTTASVVNNNYFGEAPTRNSIRTLDEESRSSIPKFSRSLVDEESFSIN